MEKRLFFGLSIEAPWPPSYPKGRIIEETSRHITLAFLGNSAPPNLSSLPLPQFSRGPTAIADSLEFLPKFKPRVVAYHIHWKTGWEALEHYREALTHWLEDQGHQIDKRPFHSHLSIARQPFVEAEWEASFEPLPLVVTGLHLYESIGNLRYPSLFTHSFTLPFEEFEHTADIAFLIRGKALNEILAHAFLAMSFKYPPLLAYEPKGAVDSLDEIVRLLNQMIAQCDSDCGCPFKAVSYHGKQRENEQAIEWEMVVDV